MAKKDLYQDKKVKKPGGAPEQVVIQKLEIRPWHRTSQDIPNWRRSIQSAESEIPRRNLIYNLYADVELDGHVESVVGKRKDAVTGANWKFQDKEGKDVDVVNKLIDTIGFNDLLEEILASRFWGYSILEPTFWKGGDDNWQMDAGLLPRLNYRPELGKVAFDHVTNEGISIREGIYAKTIMEVGKVKDLGLYMKAAPYQILKRGGLGDWAAFIQVFGNPLIDATWDGFDEKQRLELKQALDNLGAGGTIIRPEGTNIEIKENRTKDTGDAHGSFMRFLNSEISKALLGTTETTESSTSSGYAQSKTHQDEDDRKHENDINFTRRILNSRFITILKAQGFAVDGGEFVVQGEEEELTKKESFEIHKGIAMEIELPIEDEFWYENYGIPKPENYEALKKEKQAQKDPPVQNPKPPIKEDPKKKPEEDVTLASEEEVVAEVQSRADRFIRWLTDFFVKAPAVTTGAKTAACGSHHTITLAEEDRIKEDALIERIWSAQGKARWDADLFNQTADTLIKGFKAGWKAGSEVKLVGGIDLGIKYGEDDPAMLASFEQNLFVFSGAKTLAQVQELNQLFNQASSFQEFYQLAKARTEIFNRDWLETEYNTAVLTGESAATYNRLLKQAEIFPYWEYRTAGDHLVRPAHQLLNGLILPANDPLWSRIFPPNGWNCRCYVVPRMKHEFDRSKLKQMRKRAEAYLNSPQGLKENATGWGVNRAAAGTVFTANQQYARKFPGKASKELNSLRFHDFGLQSYSQARKAGKTDINEYEGAARDFYDQLKEGELAAKRSAKIIRDYHNKPLLLNEKNFTRHSTDDGKRRQHRTAYLLAMQEALEDPHEVWISGSTMQNVLYVRYYLGQTIIVRGRIENGVTELVSWFNLAEKKETIDKIRKGLLVYKK